MYLHLGNDMVINTKDLIGIFDMDNTTVSPKTRDFLKKAQKNGDIVDACDDLPKSFILTKKKENNRVYISSLATRTLLKRTKSDTIII